MNNFFLHITYAAKIIILIQYPAKNIKKRNLVARTICQGEPWLLAYYARDSRNVLFSKFFDTRN